MNYLTLNLWLEISILVVVLAILLIVASILIIRHLRKEYKKVFKIQSRFDIELRKLVNIMHKFLQIQELEDFHKQVIKKLPHEEKLKLLNLLNKNYAELDLSKEENAYVIETYTKLDELRRERDSLVIVYNDKISLFPFNLYARIMKFKKFKLYIID